MLVVGQMNLKMISDQKKNIFRYKSNDGKRKKYMFTIVSIRS